MQCSERLALSTRWLRRWSSLAAYHGSGWRVVDKAVHASKRSQGGEDPVGFYNIVAAMARRWYVSLVAVLVAIGGWALLMEDGGCFTTSTVVTFSLDSRAIILPDSGLEDSNVIAFAGMVANEINEGRAAPPYASREAPLYGVGVRHGAIVGLPNLGGQWTRYYPRAEIEIQIVGRTQEEVRERQVELVDRALQISRQVQQANSPIEGRIHAAVLPMTGDIQEITPSRLSRVVALAALLMSATLLSGGVSAQLERRWPRMFDEGSEGHMTELNET